MTPGRIKQIVAQARELGLARARIEEKGEAFEFEFAPPPPPEAAQLSPVVPLTKEETLRRRAQVAYGSGGFIPEVSDA